MAIEVSVPRGLLGPTRAQHAAVRAWLQGIPAKSVAEHWLSTDPDQEWTEATALEALRQGREALILLALRQGNKLVANALVKGAGTSTPEFQKELQKLERLGSPVPKPGHLVHLWFSAPLARRLSTAGVTTLGDLLVLANDRGRSWWRRVPRIGPTAAATIVRTLVACEDSVGRLGAHVTGAELPVPTLAPLAPGHGKAVPFEFMRVPALLDGSAGQNRAEQRRCRIGAINDYQAIQTWLSLWPSGGSTWRAYRKEAERFLAWAILERHKAFSDLSTEDCVAYRAFLSQKDFGPRWSGPQVARSLPGWRPFQGALSPRSRDYAEKVVSALCEWLVGRRYLDSNPWDGVPALRVATPSIDVEKAVPVEVWRVLMPWLDEQAANGAYWRTVRAVMLVLHDSGMRVFEAASADRAELRRTAGEGPVWGEMEIVGKRTKLRMVPISQRAYDALLAHWRDRNAVADSGGPLFAPVKPGASPRARAKAAQGRAGYSDRGLRHLVDRAGEAFRAWLAEHHSDLAKNKLFLHPHAFRHAFGTDATDANVPGDVVQNYLGHASPATTAIYNKAGARRRQGEIGKLFGTT